MMAAVTSQFAISLFTSLITSKPQENVVISPSSVSSALAMVAAGSRGKTLDEIGKVFAWKAGSNDGLATAILQEGQSLAKGCSKSCSLKSANGIWLDNGFIVSQSYKTFLEMFGLQAAKVDFKTNSVGATEKINKWVEEHTNKKISKIFEEVLDELTRMVLVNAIYFKGNWLMPFDKEQTLAAPFHVGKGKEVSVQMMYHSGDFRYINDMNANCDIVQLQYEGSAFSMIVIVPHEIDGLAKVTSLLDVSQLGKWKADLDTSRKETVDVFLPKFKVSYRVDLKKSLGSLGISEMFCDRANLTGMSEAGNLYVSSAVHEAVIEVNEEGTEAAGATGIGINFMSLPPQVRADRPFLFMIISNKTNGIVFIGKMVDPSK